MFSPNEIQSDKARDPLRHIVLVAISALVLVQIGFYWYWFGVRLGLPLSERADVWGQFGDYVGGMLNPIAAFFALLWLMRSVKLQETELTETRRVLADSAAAQQSQLVVMRRDQQLASLSSLVQAKTSLLVEAGRLHQYYVSQLRGPGECYDVSGKLIRMSDIKRNVEESDRLLKSLTEDLKAATAELTLVTQGVKK